MYGYFSFRYFSSSVRDATLVIFCATEPNVEGLIQAVQEYCDANMVPDEIAVLCCEPCNEALRSIVDSDDFRRKLPVVTRYHNPPPVRSHFFGSDGSVATAPWLDGAKRVGLTHLFKTRNALLRSNAAHHYIKPSGQHCGEFLRAGNALVDGAEIAFVAFCCLQHVPSNIKHFYCDTGAIASVAMAINGIRAQFERGSVSATINSFGSYSGLDTFKFREMDQAVILISASTSGGLVERLLETDGNIGADQVITLFSLQSEEAPGKVVCDLAIHLDENPQGLTSVESYDPHACPLCQTGSTAIAMSGDQFLPEGVEVEAVVLAADGAPRWLWSFLREYVGTGFVRANYRVSNTQHATKDVFFDLERMLSAEDMLNARRYAQRFEQMTTLAIPARAARIITLDDPASTRMAKRLISSGLCNAGVEVVPMSDVGRNVKVHVRTVGATLVVAAAIASGRNLLGVAQVLRHIQPNNAVTYLVGLARMADDKALRDLRTNVTYGDHPDERGFFVIDQVLAPVHNSATDTSWDREGELLAEMLNSLDDTDIRGLIEARQSDLEGASSKNVRGLQDNLFWPSQSGTSLRLRSGFAFFDFDYDDRQVSQADVFFTVLSVLHNVRNRDRGRYTLRQTERHKTVISPRCFERFNDGIVQAALLRAATAAELDYSTSESLSQEMEQILEFTFLNAHREAGEAAREFVLALALKRLKVVSTSLTRLKGKFGKPGDDKFIEALWNTIT